MTDGVTVIERYSISINSSNLRDESDKFSPTDILKAVAWSDAAIGSVLIRLQAEYDGIEKPKPLSHTELVQLALVQHSDAKEPKERIKEKQIKAQKEAARWMQNEKTLFMGKLKTIHKAIDVVTGMCEKARVQNPKAVAAALTGYWLNQLCTVCHGLKAPQLPDTPTLSAKPCYKCAGSGFALAPYGQSGRKVLNNMDKCVGIAKNEAQRKMK